MPYVIPQLAPSRNEPPAIQKVQQKGPYDTLGTLARRIAIANAQLVFVVNGPPYGFHVNRLLQRVLALPDDEILRFNTVNKFNWHNACQSRHCFARCFRERRVRLVRHPERPKNERVHFLDGEHDRGQKESGAQKIANARLSLDAGPKRPQ